MKLLTLILLASFASAVLSPAKADEVSIMGAKYAANTFAHSCLVYANRTQALREKVKSMGMPELTPEAKTAFMKDRNGMGFDASSYTQQGLMRMALISDNNDSCTILAEHSDQDELLKTLMANLDVMKASNGTSYRLLGEHDDSRAPSLHHRDYLVMINNMPFNLVVSTTTANVTIRGYLTLSPRSAAEPIPPSAIQ